MADLFHDLAPGLQQDRGTIRRALLASCTANGHIWELKARGADAVLAAAFRNAGGKDIHEVAVHGGAGAMGQDEGKGGIFRAVK